MYTYLEISSGPQQGKTYRLRPHIRVGSGDCEIRLEDPELPALHSQVMFDSNDQLVLVCTNAVYEIISNGRSSKKVVLENGIHLRVGSTSFQVLVTTKSIGDALDPLKPVLNHELTLKKEFTLHQEPNSSRNNLIAELHRLAERAPKRTQAEAVRLFKHPVKLTVKQGPQADDEFIFSWGPREFGPMALEFPVEFPPFPGILFTLSPSENGDIVFNTKHPDFARVSGQTDTTCVIAMGDHIEVGNSIILVERLEDKSDYDEN